MLAIQVREGRLAQTEMPAPEPGPGEVRIRVRATAVNRADLLQVKGLYPPPPGAPDVLGLECAGEIDAVGPGVERWQLGDAVCALLAGGGYAEQVVCPAQQVLPLPQGLDFSQAAALPEVFATAWLDLCMEGAMQPGERVLLHAGASGVGTAAIQVCRLVGARCWVTAGSPHKIARCVELGAEDGHVRHDGPFTDAPWAADGFDLVLDPVGGPYLAQDLRVLRRGGRLVIIALMGGRRAEVDLAPILSKGLRIVGSTLRSRPPDEKGRILEQLEQHVWPALARGTIRPVIDSVLPISRAVEAHDLLASDRTVGKVVLSVS